MRQLLWIFWGLMALGGCSFVDRQQPPELLDVRSDRGSEPSVGRGQDVRITILTSDPDNDELDFRWIASGGVFVATQRDTIVDLFQDSVTVVWRAPLATGVYELFLEVSDGRSGEIVTSSLRIAVTQVPPVAVAGRDQILDYRDELIVELDGRESFDPDGDVLTYIWEQVGGPRVPLENRIGPAPKFDALAPADYIFSLRVADIVQGVGDTSDVAILRVRVSDRKGREPDG